MRLQKLFQQVEIEHRLGDDVLRAGFHLPVEAPHLFIHVRSAPGLAPTPISRAVCEPIGIAADIEPLIQVVDDVRQPDGIDVENGRGIGIGAHARRIAGDADQVADAGGVRAQQLRLNAQDVAVAAAEVKHRFDAGLLLNQLAGHLRAHTGAGARTVGHVDAVDAVLLTELRAGDFSRRVDAARRQNFDKRDELARRELRAELGLLSHRHFGEALYLGLVFVNRHRRAMLR